jgi:hypothetical protein
MRNASGYAVITSPEAARITFDKFTCDEVRVGTSEYDTFQCVHCNRHVHVLAKAPLDQFGSMCRNCMKRTCPKCADGPCVPFMKKLEMAEKRDRALRSYGF